MNIYLMNIYQMEFKYRAFINVEQYAVNIGLEKKTIFGIFFP